jgi:hypothetical protein
MPDIEWRVHGAHDSDPRVAFLAAGVLRLKVADLIVFRVLH